MSLSVSEKQKKLLDLAIGFDKVCAEHGVGYSLSCGTALGAVREKGFIPWDDDFDIMMTLPEYRRMNEIYKTGDFPFLWLCRETDSGSPVVFARVYEKEADLDELEKYPYIDIHVYVGCGGLCRETEKRISKTDLLVKIYWFKKRTRVYW